MLTQSRLKELVRYDAETGIFTRMRATGRWGRFPAGSAIGGCGDIVIAGKTHATYRLAWLYMTGEWPDHEVDHINGDPADNRWSNLRAATHAENGRNLKRSKANTSGLKGVHVHRRNRLWRARIAPSGKSICLGIYNCPAAAHFAYLVASDKHFGEFTRVEGIYRGRSK
jgi:hypothetical protein